MAGFGLAIAGIMIALIAFWSASIETVGEYRTDGLEHAIAAALLEYHSASVHTISNLTANRVLVSSIPTGFLAESIALTSYAPHLMAPAGDAMPWMIRSYWDQSAPGTGVLWTWVETVPPGVRPFAVAAAARDILGPTPLVGLGTSGAFWALEADIANAQASWNGAPPIGHPSVTLPLPAAAAIPEGAPIRVAVFED